MLQWLLLSFIEKCICVTNKVAYFLEFFNVKISHVLEIKKFDQLIILY